MRNSNGIPLQPNLPSTKTSSCNRFRLRTLKLHGGTWGGVVEGGWQGERGATCISIQDAGLLNASFDPRVSSKYTLATGYRSPAGLNVGVCLQRLEGLQHVDYAGLREPARLLKLQYRSLAPRPIPCGFLSFYRGYIGVICGLYWDNGKCSGNYYSRLAY